MLLTAVSSSAAVLRDFDINPADNRSSFSSSAMFLLKRTRLAKEPSSKLSRSDS